MNEINELACWLALAYRSDLTMRQVKGVLIPWCLTRGRQLVELLERPESFWRQQLGLSDDLVAGLKRTRHNLLQGADVLAQLADHGIELVTFADPAYPQLLAEALDPLHRPALLFLQGDFGLLTEPGVAILGDDTGPEAADFARQVAHHVAADDVNTVLQARDPVGEAALAGALEADSLVTLVVPEGLLRFRPDPALAVRLGRGGVLFLSPVEPSQPFDQRLADPCLRVTAGLARQLVIVATKADTAVWQAIHDAVAARRPVCLGPDAATGEDREALLAAGVVVVRDPAEAAESVVRHLADGMAVLGLAEVPGEPSPVEPPAEEESAPLEPEALISLLERSGRVPEQLKRRLKST